jgi:hypothetical protein
MRLFCTGKIVKGEIHWQLSNVSLPPDELEFLHEVGAALQDGTLQPLLPFSDEDMDLLERDQITLSDLP